jgi:hypothetical protein
MSLNFTTLFYYLESFPKVVILLNVVSYHPAEICKSSRGLSVMTHSMQQNGNVPVHSYGSLFVPAIKPNVIKSHISLLLAFNSISIQVSCCQLLDE